LWGSHTVRLGYQIVFDLFLFIKKRKRSRQKEKLTQRRGTPLLRDLNPFGSAIFGWLLKLELQEIKQTPQAAEITT
jgi:hypothetical protein